MRTQTKSGHSGLFHGITFTAMACPPARRGSRDAARAHHHSHLRLQGSRLRVGQTVRPQERRRLGAGSQGALPRRGPREEEHRLRVRPP
eukprot:7382298-Prymnesium_polylepis.2